MRPLLVVEFDVFPDACAGLGHVCIGMQVNFLVFDAAPEALDEDIAPLRAFTVHRD
jgi:hypothetical protein